MAASRSHEPRRASWVLVRTAFAATLLVALGWLTAVQPYGEAPTTLDVFPADRLQCGAEGSARVHVRLLSPQDCSVASLHVDPLPTGSRTPGAVASQQTVSGTIAVAVEVKFPASLRNTVDEICLWINARSSKQLSFWYLIPPPPFHDERTRLCEPLEEGDWRPGDALHHAAVTIRGQVGTAAGHTVLSASISATDAWKDIPLACVADARAVIEVIPPFARPRDIAEVARAAEIVRWDEAPYTVQRLQHHREMAAKYRPHSRHPGLRLEAPGLPSAASAGAGAGPNALLSLRPLLDRRLYDALQDGSPAAIAKVMEGVTLAMTSNDDWHRHPHVASFPIFNAKACQMLMEELENAKERFPHAADLSIPNNVGNETRSRRTGVVLADLGLDRLAQALVSAVLTPLSRVLYPRWAPESFDSYHAFSIHVAPLHNRSEPAEGKVVGDRLPEHIDVCEVSMNICLGKVFSGSDVHFTRVNGVNGERGGLRGWNTTVAGGAGGARRVAGQWVHHQPGWAFINLCQQFHSTNKLQSGERHSLVVRGLSSSFRRAPAELFAGTCVRETLLGDHVLRTQTAAEAHAGA